MITAALLLALAMQSGPGVPRSDALRDNPRWRAAVQQYQQCLSGALDDADLDTRDADAAVAAAFSACAPARNTARAAAQADRSAEEAERLMTRADSDLRDATQAEAARRHPR